MDDFNKNFRLLGSDELLEMLNSNEYTNWNNYFLKLATLIEKELEQPSDLRDSHIKKIRQKITDLEDTDLASFLNVFRLYLIWNSNLITEVSNAGT